MLADQARRDEFTGDLLQNFSVIASPGTGKTTAITERIANLVRSNWPVENFIAVTYTDRAAKEIGERVYGKILADGAASESTLKNLGGVFFGTIHSFCAKFLREHRERVQLAEDFEIVGDDGELWLKFTAQMGATIGKIVPVEMRNHLASHFKLGEILARARKILIPAARGTEFEPPPVGCMAEILSFEAGAKESKIRDFQGDVEVWMSSNGTCSFPEIPAIRGRKTGECFLESLRRYLRWKSEMEDFLANKISEAYAAFKISNNSLSYGDLTALTLKILLDGEYRKNCVPNYGVILDEAQDTDEIQFKILLNLASPELYGAVFGEGKGGVPPMASFSMVGDPKQSIYADRADVKFYISVHSKLVGAKFLKHLDFSVTMRCPRRVVEFVNTSFGRAFSSSGLEFVPMCARPGSRPGCVEVLKGDSVDTLVQLLSTKTCDDWGVECFSEICILAPRKSWLSEVAKFCGGSGTLPSMQLGFGETLEGVPSLVKWTASLLHFLNNICDHRELAGILREIFGISTREVIQFFNHGSSAICESIHGELAALKYEQRFLPLPNFVRKILDKFNLVSRVRILNLFPEGEINSHYESIMDATYQANLSCDDLEKKLIGMYRNPRVSPTVDKDAVQLLSFHGSKGLEWPVVILPFMHRERKLMKSKFDADALENERRMLFVACTRAKERLILVDDSEHYAPSGRSNMISSHSLISAREILLEDDGVNGI